MGWIIVVAFCLLIGGWIYTKLLDGRIGAEDAREGKPGAAGQFYLGWVVCAAVVFVVLVLIGLLKGGH